QQHITDSPYHFQRLDCPPSDTLPNHGRGSPVAPTGMTWSGFRPSDDACTYGYLVPANMFAVVVLGYAATIAREVHQDEATAAAAESLAAAIERGIREFAIVDHADFGPIYAYETDGMGHYVLMDDANIPSLLALPYLGYCTEDDPIYRNTRAFVLSTANPYFYQGRAARGIGSPHTSTQHIWPLALAMQGLTSTDQFERETMLELLARTDANTGLMHESFHADDPRTFTRPWFGWANSLFSELVLAACGLAVPGSPLTAREGMGRR
ncbi:MAG: glycoside hydrolase family 125 protein, partial [Roseiflexaceae bacterium]|nr:glycoside hydrolase family 125 protein [Roseiflexaceae bacterium]